MYGNRQQLWLTIFLAVLSIVVPGILINVGTADKPLQLLRDLWSSERRWIWVAVVAVLIVVVLAQQLISRARTPSSETEAEFRKSLPYTVRNRIKGIFQWLPYSRKPLLLHLEECPDLVQPRYREDNAPASLTRKLLPPDRLIKHWHSGCKWLIVGQRGAGKSTTLRELAQDLIDRGDLPVVINLPAWEQYCKRAAIFSDALFSEWLVQELKISYRIEPEIGKQWIDEHQLVFLLDGLDEVTEDWRDRCIKSINHFSENSPTEIVVCSQLEIYETLPTRLHFDQAFCIQPLSVKQK